MPEDRRRPDESNPPPWRTIKLGPPGSSPPLAMSSDGRTLACFNPQCIPALLRDLALFSMSRRSILKRFNHVDYSREIHVQKMKFSPDGRTLAIIDSMASSFNLCLMDIESGRIINDEYHPCRSASPIAFHPTKPMVAWASMSAFVDVWNYEAGIRERWIGQQEIRQIAFRHSSRKDFVLASTEPSLHTSQGRLSPLLVWELRGCAGQPPRNLKLLGWNFRGFCVSESQRLIVVYRRESAQPSLQILDPNTYKVLRHITDGLDGPIFEESASPEFVFSENDEILNAVGAGRLRQWFLASAP